MKIHMKSGSLFSTRNIHVNILNKTFYVKITLNKFLMVTGIPRFYIQGEISNVLFCFAKGRFNALLVLFRSWYPKFKILLRDEFEFFHLFFMVLNLYKLIR